MKTKLMALILVFVLILTSCMGNAPEVTTEASSTTRSTGPTMTAAPGPSIDDLVDTTIIIESDNFENFLNEINNWKYYKGLFEEEGKIESISLLSDEYELDDVRLMDPLTCYFSYDTIEFEFESIVDDATYGDTVIVRVCYYFLRYQEKYGEIFTMKEALEEKIFAKGEYNVLEDGSVYVPSYKQLLFSYDGYIHEIEFDIDFDGELNWQDIVEIETIYITET